MSTYAPFSLNFDTIGAGLVVRDAHGRAFEANAQAAHLIELSRDILTTTLGATNWLSDKPRESSEGSACHPPFPASHAAGDVVSVQTRSGSLRRFRVSLHPLRKDGHDGFAVAFFDLTDASPAGASEDLSGSPASNADLEPNPSFVEALRRSVSAGDIAIALQPQFRLSTGAVCGFETLARWRWQDTDISPELFVRVANEHGFGLELGQTVLGKALRAFMAMDALGHLPPRIAVNLSASELGSDAYPDMLRFVLDEHGVAPNMLELEITEGILLDRDPERIRRNLDMLHAMGVRIALDDFGTGYASLTHLKQFHIDTLKIDKSFVAGLPEASDDAAIVGSMIDLAHNLGMDVVAEGIETPAQLHHLTEHGCDVGQGYLLGRPKHPEEAIIPAGNYAYDTCKSPNSSTPATGAGGTTDGAGVQRCHGK